MGIASHTGDHAALSALCIARLTTRADQPLGTDYSVQLVLPGAHLCRRLAGPRTALLTLLTF